MLGLVATITFLLALTAAADARRYNFDLLYDANYYPRFTAAACPARTPATATRELPRATLRFVSSDPTVGETRRPDPDYAETGREPSVRIVAVDATATQIPL